MPSTKAVPFLISGLGHSLGWAQGDDRPDGPCTVMTEEVCLSSWYESCQDPKAWLTGFCADPYISNNYFEDSGRCAFVDGHCVPNCLHVKNQQVWACESDFCTWDGQKGKCSFNPSKAAIRRSFCDKAAGGVDRRYVDKDGSEPDFYDHGNHAEGTNLRKWHPRSNQKLFCRNMLGDDDDQWVKENADPADAIIEGMVRCWRPNPGNRDSYKDPAVQKEMLDSLNGLFKNSANPYLHPDVMYSSLGLLTQTGIAKHHTVGLTNQYSGTGTSWCQEFEYGSSPTNMLDQAGCNFFTASFQKVQELTACIMPLINDDMFKQLWIKIGEVVKDNPNDSTFDLRDRLGRDPYVEWLMTFTNGVLKFNPLADLVKSWQTCADNKACAWWQTDFERAIEIIKQVEQDSWEGLDTSAIRAMLKRRVLSSLGAPPDGDLPALQEGTVEKIVSKCFKVPAAGPPQDLVLKESLRCTPMMWDSVQIPALPNTALVPRRDRTEEESGPSQELSHIHPLCGRIALAGLVRQFSRTKYPTRSWKLLRLLPMSDHTCLVVTGAQCINFKDCWMGFLRNHVGKIHEKCVPAASSSVAIV